MSCEDTLPRIYITESYTLNDSEDNRILSTGNFPEAISMNDDAYNETFKKKVVELYNIVRGVNTDNVDIKTAYDIIFDKQQSVNIASEISVTDDLDDNRQKFHNEKNKLITMMAKNQNIYNKLNKNNFLKYIFLAILLLFVIGLSFIFVQGDSSTGSLDVKTAYILMISLSLTVMLLFVMIDIYQLFTRKNYETFSEDAIKLENPTVNDLQNITCEYLHKLEVLIQYMEDIKTQENGKKTEIIDSILHDFNNINYVNMRRYQITDYKINESRNRMHFVKYGFFIASMIGLLAGLYLRSKDTAMNASTTFTITRDMFYGGSILLIISYLLIYFLHQRQNMIRKKYNWNKLYWNIKAIQDNN